MVHERFCVFVITFFGEVDALSFSKEGLGEVCMSESFRPPSVVRRKVEPSASGKKNVQ